MPGGLFAFQLQLLGDPRSKIAPDREDERKIFLWILTLGLDDADADSSTLLIEWSAPPDPDLDIDDPAVWRMASPH